MKRRGTPSCPSRTTAALVAGVIGAATLVGTTTPALAGPVAWTGPPAAQVQPDAPPPVAWTPCGDPWECATVAVPLDHDRPDGPTIDLELVRAPATSPEQRIGSLFLNPGGPGGSGVEYAFGVQPFLPAEIRERFDVVGFDPRGIARSTPLRCYATFQAALGDLPGVPYPETPEEEDHLLAADRRLAGACRGHAGPVLAHMSTADVARDLDLLRQAVGDDALTYLGFSYGSVLGQTYANLFPDRVRALAIDGVIDPRAWVGDGIEARTAPVGTRLRSAGSAQATLGEFFRLCDEAGPECAISGGAADRYARLAARLRVAPIELTDEFGTYVVTYQDVVAVTLGALYATQVWPELALALHELMEPVSPVEVRSSLATLRAELGLDSAEPVQGPVQEEYPNVIEGTYGVACADAANPRSDRRYRQSADAAEQTGYFGRFWTWTWSACLRWPGQAGLDRYDGPWTATTAHPVLVVGNLFDPATGHHGAVAASQLLPSSTLVTYTGWGHTAYLQGNACVDGTVTQYLLTPAAAGEDVVCEAQGSPFTTFAVARAMGPANPAVTATLPAAVRQALGAG